MQRQVYPLGEQNFKCIREENKVYVDKTGFIPRLLENKFYFLGRPRRFGKSLFLSMLENFFLGNKSLFKGLAVENFEWDWKRHAVLHIDLTGADYTGSGSLETRLSAIFKEYENDFNIDVVYPDSMSERFRALIKGMSKSSGLPVVILVDEYEKPLLDVADNSGLLEKYKNLLSGIYSVIKSEEEKIKLALFTGVTRFGHLNIFSGLNNLIDISLSDEFATVCGISEKELNEYFTPGIKILADTMEISESETIAQLKYHYDGYHFSPSMIDIYNPFSVMNCFYTRRFTSQWFQSGSSSFLLSRLRQAHYNITEIEGITVNEGELSGVDSQLNQPVTLLYQSGYLTIKDYDRKTDQFTLGFPNYEVSTAFYDSVIPFYLGAGHRIGRKEILAFVNFLEEGEPDKAMSWLEGFFGSIPYDVKLNYESDFQEVIYCFFALAGLLSGTTLEKQTSQGRIDMVFETKRFTYIFEFKKGYSAEEAVRQIKQKQYAAPWLSSNKKVFIIGVAFSAEKRGISSYIIE